MLKLDEQDDGRTIEVGIGQELELCLPENPTTGFRWQLTQAAEGIGTLLDHAFEPGGQPGQPGVHRWRFKIVVAGAATVALAYRRAWEPDPAPGRTFFLCLRTRT